MGDKPSDDECPVCFVAPATHCVVGCDHAFCEACVAEWCLAYRAFCPLCRQKVFGILSNRPHRVYVSPHHGPWRVRFRQLCGALEIVEADDLTRAHGLEEGSRVHVNGGHDVARAQAALDAACRAQRLVQVDVLEGAPAVRHCGNCLVS